MGRLIATVLLVFVAVSGQAGNTVAMDNVGACTVGLKLLPGQSCEIREAGVFTASANRIFLAIPLARNLILSDRELAIKLLSHPDDPDFNPNARTGTARFGLQSDGCPGEVPMYPQSEENRWSIGQP